ncbi:NLRC3, partial [Symbiodinium sp. KB8]
MCTSAALGGKANFNLEQPQKLAAYLKYADIRLLRVEYLYELLRQERLLPRRQEATREHPDPCGDQLKRLVSCLSLYDAAYFSEIWVFYDYVSLFQYERQTDAEYESFRRSMNHMHMCYAHECNWTVRLEALTPDDVWDAALQNSEHLVMVYDDESKSVRGRPLKELMPNRVPYRDRGWCKAEVEWSSCRSRSEQNQQID